MINYRRHLQLYYAELKCNIKKKGSELLIPINEIEKLISQDCEICGCAPKSVSYCYENDNKITVLRNTIYRRNTSIPFTLDNVFTICKGCLTTLTQTEDLLGNKYGRLLVIEKVDNYNTSHNKYWKCLCDCGKTHIAAAGHLKSGGIQSCGCFAQERRVDQFSTKTPMRGILSVYKKRAKDLNVPYTLTEEEFEILTSGNCHYCDSPPSNFCNRNYTSAYDGKKHKKFLYSGLDRLDNSKGYELNNVVPCCWPCNSARNSKSVDEFLSLVKLIYKNGFSKSIFDKKSSNILLVAREVVKRNGRGYDDPLIRKSILLTAAYCGFKGGASRRNKEFNISLAEFFGHVEQPCSYCGRSNINSIKDVCKKINPSETIFFTGIDRMNNDIGYTPENITACCKDCNRVKRTMSIEDFYNHIEKIVKHTGI